MTFEAGAVDQWAPWAMTNFPDALCLVDTEGKVQWAGGAIESVTGGLPESIVGRKIEELLHPDDHRVGIAQFLLIFSGDLPATAPVAHFRIRADNGTWVPVSVSAMPLAPDGGKPLILLSARKTPEKATLEEVLEQLVAGTPMVDVLASVMRLWEPRHELERVGLVVRTADESFSIGTDLPQPLDGTLDLGGASPWEQARERRATIKMTSPSQLPPHLRDEADREGLVGGWFVPIDAPGATAEAMLVVWTRPASPLGLLEDSALVETTVRLVTLVMGWNEHLATLTAAAGTDPLTGAANRSAFIDALDSSPTATQRTLLYIDLDGFKPVNDRFGHGVGDDVLVEVARRLKGAVRAKDLVARLGGDEFAVLCHGLRDRLEAIAVAERVMSALAAPIHLADTDVTITVGASIGIAEATAEWPNTVSLLEIADRALLDAKAAGRSRWHYADSSSSG